MFTVMKVREGLAADDYSDPGWFDHPPGTVAYEWTGSLPEVASMDEAATVPPQHAEPVRRVD